MADLDLRALATRIGASEIRLNDNTKTLLSLRGTPRTGLRISLHHRLLQHPDALEDLRLWIQGRTVSPRLRGAIDQVFISLKETQRATVAPVLEPLNGSLDLQATYRRIHDTWFSHLPLIPIGWARERSGRLRHIRFAAFHRVGARISVNPRVDQPWVARLWVDFLIFHEICHHAQACRPIPGETPHSARFKSWERRFPQWEQAVAWEKAHVDRFLSA